MTEIITAIYENGVLRPLQPLRLKEKQRVRVHVFATSIDEQVDERQRALATLIAADLIEDETWPDVPDEDPVSAERRAELARMLGAVSGKLLSEIAIEDRGEW